MQIFKVIVVYKKQEYLRNTFIKGVAAVSSSHLLRLDNNSTSFSLNAFVQLEAWPWLYFRYCNFVLYRQRQDVQKTH